MKEKDHFSQLFVDIYVNDIPKVPVEGAIADDVRIGKRVGSTVMKPGMRSRKKSAPIPLLDATPCVMRRPLVMLLCFTAGCTPAMATTPSLGTVTSDAPVSGPSVTSPSTTSVLAVSEKPPIATPQHESNSRIVVLAADEERLRMALPAFAPGRYVHWRETGSIQVGKSHLQDAEVLGGEQFVLVRSAMEPTARIYDRVRRQLETSVAIPGLQQSSRADFTFWPGASPTTFLVGKRDGIWRFDPRSGREAVLLDATPVTAVRWSPDNKILVGVHSETQPQHSVMYFYEKTGTNELSQKGSISFSNRVDAWDLTADNRFLAISNYPSNTAELIDLHSGKTLWTIPTPAYVGALSISPDGRSVAIGGESLVLVNLADPDRRTVFETFQNNIGTVRYSPSSDAVVTTSYDGKVRIFAWDADMPSLTLVKTLSHTGRANVYAASFFNQGEGLVTSSGDQTVRFWGAPKSTVGSSAIERRYIPPRDSEISRLVDQENRVSSRPAWPTSPEALREMLSSRFHPPSLDQSAKPSSILPGAYGCRISEPYKMRQCLVTREASGHTLLEVKEGNLLGIKGVLYDDGAVVRFEGWLTDERPFRCVTCQERCYLSPGSCACQPNALERSVSCAKQAIHGVFRGQGSSWKGVVFMRSYGDDQLRIPLPAPGVAFEEGTNQYKVELKKL